MFAKDFSYDDRYLSDFNMIICSFDGSSGSETVSAGSKITFNTVPVNKGQRFNLTGTQYDECIQATFTIAKNPCGRNQEEMKITNDEYRDLMRWLNRREYLRFQIFDEDEKYRDACYYDASFNVEKILIGGKLYGLTLTMETNRPFGYGKEYVVTHNITNSSKNYKVYDISDEIGYICPDMVITCKGNGTLTLKNKTLDCTMQIKGCTAGEVITIKGESQIISTTCDSHDICDDFNYEFFKIGNTFDDRENLITSSLSCELEIRYYPIIKDTPI